MFIKIKSRLTDNDNSPTDYISALKSESSIQNKALNEVLDLES